MTKIYRNVKDEANLQGRDGFWWVQIATEGPEEGEKDPENGRENGSIPGRLGLEGIIEQKRANLNREMDLIYQNVTN